MLNRLPRTTLHTTTALPRAVLCRPTEGTQLRGPYTPAILIGARPPVGVKSRMISRENVDTADERHHKGLGTGGLLKAARDSLRGFIDWLHEKKVTPNQITTTSLGLCLTMGILTALNPAAAWPFFALPAVAGVRLLLDVIDGSLARRHDLKTDFGSFLNEFEYIASDISLYLPFALVPGVNSTLVFVAVGMAVVSEIAGVLGKKIGEKRRFDGPLAKFERTVIFGAAAIALALGVSPTLYHWFDILLGTTAAALAYATYVRIRNADPDRPMELAEKDLAQREKLVAQALRGLGLERLTAQAPIRILDLDSQLHERDYGVDAAAQLQRDHAYYQREARLRVASEFEWGLEVPLQHRDLTLLASSPDIQAVIHSGTGENLSKARGKALEQGQPHRFTFPVGDWSFLSSLTERPNLVNLGLRWEKFPDPNVMAQEAREIFAAMAPGGHLVVSSLWKPRRDFTANFTGVDEDDIEMPDLPYRGVMQILAAEGFRIVEAKVTKGKRFTVLIAEKPLRAA